MRPTVLLPMFAVAFAASAQPAAQPEEKVDVRATHLAGPAHMLTATAEAGSGNLVFSAGPDGILLVDAFTPEWAERIRAALDSVSTAPVRFIVNTHFHGDHVGGNTLFGRDATIFSRPGVRARMMVEIHPPWNDSPTPPRPPHAWPAVTYDSPVTLHFNGEEIRLIPFPRSHTDADTVVFFTGSRVLAIGDLMYILRGRLGPVSDDWSGGDMQSLERNLAALLPQLPADVKIVSGHGRVLTLADLSAFHRITKRTLDVVRQRIAAGKNLEQIVAEGLPADLNGLGDWELATASWLRTAHESLSRSAASPQSETPQATVASYHQALAAGDAVAVRATLGKEFIMFNGNFSGEPTAWQAHMYLTGKALDDWPALFLKEAGPYQNESQAVSTHVRGNAAIVVTRDTGKNRFRAWKEETVTWFLGRRDGQWRIVAMFIRDIRNPE